MHGRKREDRSRLSTEDREAQRAKIVKYGQLSSLALKTRKHGAQVSDAAQALELSGQLLRVNPDVYTLWNHRREIILSQREFLCLDAQQAAPSEKLNHELQLLVDCIQKSPKAYCVWHHRQWLFENLHSKLQATVHIPALVKMLEKESFLCARFLDADERNFHCWNYRRFVVRLHPNRTAKEEFNYTTERIRKNFSSFSAFHHRTIYIDAYLRETNAEYLSEANLIRSELDIIQQAIFTEPDDQTAWWYHQYLIKWAKECSQQQQQRLCHSLDQRQTGQGPLSQVPGLEEVEVGEEGSGSFFRCVLQEQVEMIRELLEDEEEGAYRWAVLTLASLLEQLAELEEQSRIECQERRKESVQLYRRLIDIDPDHAGRYRDILSARDEITGTST